MANLKQMKGSPGSDGEKEAVLHSALAVSVVIGSQRPTASCRGGKIVVGSPPGRVDGRFILGGTQKLCQVGAAGGGLSIVMGGPQARSNLTVVRRDCFAEFILIAAEGLAMTLGRTKGHWTVEGSRGP